MLIGVYDVMKTAVRLPAADPTARRFKLLWWLFKLFTGLPRLTRAGAQRGMQFFPADSQTTAGIRRCHGTFLLRLYTQQWRVPAACLLLFYFSMHIFVITAAHLDDRHFQHPSSAAARSGSDSSKGSYGSSASTSPPARSSSASHPAGDPALFHILWPEEPLDLDTMLRHAAGQLKVSWGNKVLAGRLSALTVDEADDFCSRIKFAVEKHLRMVFDASTHFRVFEQMPTATPFLHLSYVRDFLRSQFTRDKIKLSLPDRELEPLFKHAGGLPWRKNTDGEQLEAQMHNHEQREAGVQTSRGYTSWSHDEL